MVKKLLSILIASIMLLAIMPLTALADEDIAINETNFPDSVFRNAILNELDADHNKALSYSEIVNARVFNINEMNITSLKGIEYFTSLIELRCSGNMLTELDLSSNTRLTTLVCANNQLVTLNITKNKLLQSLVCTNNMLTELNVSNNPFIGMLYCANNQLTSLNVAKVKSLSYLNCSNNKLTEINVTNNSNICDINVSNNNLNELNLTGVTLASINCANNNIKTLDLSSSFWSLSELDCSYNPIEELDLLDVHYIYNLSTVGCPLKEIHFLHQSSTSTSMSNEDYYPCDIKLQSTDGGYVEIEYRRVFDLNSIGLTNYDSYKDFYYVNAATQPGSKFLGWYDSSDVLVSNGPRINVKSNTDDELIELDLIAKFEEGAATYHTVTYVDGLTGETIGTQGVLHGTNASFPEAPKHDGYTFTGWSHNGENITEDITITANYQANEPINTHTVTFVDGLTSDVISTSTVEHGMDVTLPEPPQHDGYTFTGWSHDGKSITEDITITANYASVALMNGDVNGDGTVNTGDAVMILKFAADMVTLDHTQMTAADVNKDQSVNTGDAVAILKYAAGMITL